MSGFYGTPVIAPAAINTIQIENSDGSTILGVVTGEETILTATDEDIKIGKIAATDGGIVEGTNTITYETTTSYRLILPGEEFSIPLSNHNIYDYTKFQCIIVAFSSDYSTSVESLAVTVNDSVFSVATSEKISYITKNHNKKSIDLNFTNDTNKIYCIRYFTYHDELEE